VYKSNMNVPMIQNWSLNLSAYLAECSAASTKPATILVMKWSAMGDIALASTVMEDICRQLPGVQIDLDTQPRFQVLFAHDQRFRKTLGIDARRSGGIGLVQWLHAVARQRYDAIIDLQSSDRSRLLMAALSLLGWAVPVRIGNTRHWPYNIAPPRQAVDVHALVQLQATIAACGLVAQNTHPVLVAGPRHQQTVDELLRVHAVHAHRYALFMPGCQAAVRLKRWGWRRFAALAMAMREQGVERVVIVGTHEERDECEAIAAACPSFVVNLCGQTSVLDLVPLASGASCVVSNDTGTAHVAAVAARPMVVVCGPTNPKRVKPAGDRVVTVQADLWCKSCYRKDCSHHSCMNVLSPQQVLQALGELGVFGQLA
jgi:heptosyltransferase-2